MPRFSLENVSLDEFTDDSKACVKANQTDSICAGECLDWENARRNEAGLPSFQHVLHQLDATELKRIRPGRWIWGDYSASSYVWGDDSGRRQVRVNGFPWPVTHNLYRILEALWLSRVPRRAMLMGNGIWADAICINQEDIAERNIQVKRIAIIYKQAYQTLAWLDYGIESSNLDQGLAVLSKIASAVEGAKESANGGERGDLKDLKRLDSSDLKSLFDVLVSPYWDRLWIIQEATISTNLTIVGKRQAMWSNELYSAVSQLMDQMMEVLQMYRSLCRDAGLDTDRRDLFLSRLFGQISRISRLLRLRTVRSPQLPNMDHLNYVMKLSCSAHQKDEKDKIYGLLSLFDEALRSAIIPDYQLSVAEVYTDFARACIHYQRSLDLICNHRSRNSEVLVCLHGSEAGGRRQRITWKCQDTIYTVRVGLGSLTSHSPKTEYCLPQAFSLMSATAWVSTSIKPLTKRIIQDLGLFRPRRTTATYTVLAKKPEKRCGKPSPSI